MWSVVAGMLLPSGSGAPAAPVARLVDAGGASLVWPLRRWAGDVTAEERRLLARAVAPVLDVGCGPGRAAGHLAAQRVDCLGLDVAAEAVRMTRRRGAAAVRRCVFEPDPAEGRWATVVLLDGNIGIGGDPPALLARVAALLAPAGRVLLDVEPPGVPSRRLRLRLASRAGGWQPWAQLGADDLPALAAGAGLTVADVWKGAGRWFAQLDA